MLKMRNHKQKLLLAIAVLVFPFMAIGQKTNYYIKDATVKDQQISDSQLPIMGTNIGVYYEESWLMNFEVQKRLHDLKPGIIRMPGGSWSNELYWNGNRVRLEKESYIDKQTWDSTIKVGGNPIAVGFDTSRYHNGLWDVDYKGYAPGFRIKNNEHELSDYHGFTDVLFLHKYIQSYGCETMVTVNMGTGTPKMAAEWVKWTKQRANYARQPFDVKYWELGNELDGDWEVGHFLPDGSAMTAAEYIRRYKIFTKAMKAADPSIKVGGSVASSMELVFIEELIADTACPIDFISFHAYPSHDNDTDFVKMANEAAKVNQAVRRIKDWISIYRPAQSNSIEIALTEWNIKVKEDITTVDIRNALWSAVMIGEMAKAGVDIAIQWDLFSTTPTGGHGMFNPLDSTMTPRSQYWASYMWSNYMQNHMVATDLNAPDYVRAYITQGKGGYAIMLINGSPKENVSICLDAEFMAKKQQANKVTFSEKQYKINPKTLIPTRSEKPEEERVMLKKGGCVELAPQSITIFQIPQKI